MPEIPTTRIRFMTEGMKYLLKLPLIVMSCLTGKAFIKPLSASIIVTNKCNLNCLFCPLEKVDREDRLTKEQYLSLIDFLSNWEVKQITFSGGEPLAYKNFFLLLKYANEKEITTGFSTNGTLMTGKNLQRIHESGVERVTVSIDGNEEAHNIIRGEGVYKKASRALEELAELQKEYGKPRIRINTVIVDQNIEDLVDLFFLAKEYEVVLNLMPLTYYRPREGDVDLRVRKGHLPLLEENLERLKRLKRREGVLFNRDYFLDLLKSYYRDPYHIKRQFKKGAYGVEFMVDGGMGFCGEFNKLGNIKEKTPKEIWRSPEFAKARIEMKRCKRCLLNCHYTPPLWELIKDFGVYPILRKIHPSLFDFTHWAVVLRKR